MIASFSSSLDRSKIRVSFNAKKIKHSVDSIHTVLRHTVFFVQHKQWVQLKKKRLDVCMLAGGFSQSHHELKCMSVTVSS